MQISVSPFLFVSLPHNVYNKLNLVKNMRIPREMIEVMYGKLIDEKSLEVNGFKKPLAFEVYDGYAYCPNYKGHEYAIEFPRMDLIEKSNEMQSDIRNWLEMADDAKITVYDIIQTFNVMYRDGVKVVYNEKKEKWVETI